MIDERIAGIVGVPNEGVSHWGLSRHDRGDWKRLDAPNRDGVRVQEWPLEELTLDNLRSRWATGDFKVHWFELDPGNPDPKLRRKSQGNGPRFSLDPEPVATPPAAPAMAVPAAIDPTASALQTAAMLIQMVDQRSNQSIQAISQLAGMRQPGAPSADTGLLQQMAEVRAELAAERVRREMSEKHRADLDEANRRYERERRAREEAERDDDGPMFSPGNGSILEQLGYGAANALAKLPPDALSRLVAAATPLIERLTGSAPPSAPPPPPVRVVPRVAPSLHGSHPSAAAAAAAAVDVSANGMPSEPIATTTSGVPVVKANGAAPAKPVAAPQVATDSPAP